MSLNETLNVDQHLLGLEPNRAPMVDPLRISIKWSDETALMEVRGEVEMATVPPLYEHLEELVPNRTSDLIIDLSRVTFLDSTGLAFLVTAYKKVKSQHSRLVVYAPTPQVRRLFAVSGLTSLLDIVPVDASEG